MTYVANAQIGMADAYIKSAETSQTRYTEMRDKLVATGRLLDKHHKTAKAAREEEEAAKAQRKAELRASGGEPSKSYRELKRNEVAARETAEEFSEMAAELKGEFQDMQTLTASLRGAYLTAFDRMARLQDQQRLEEVAGAVFSTEDGREFLSLLLHLAEQCKADTEGDDAVQELVRAAPQAAGITVDEAEKEIVDRRVRSFVYSFMQQQALRSGSSKYQRDSQPIPAGPYELDHTQVSPMAKGLAVKRLRELGFLEEGGRRE